MDGVWWLALAPMSMWLMEWHHIPWFESFVQEGHISISWNFWHQSLPSHCWLHNPFHLWLLLWTTQRVWQLWTKDTGGMSVSTACCPFYGASFPPRACAHISPGYNPVTMSVTKLAAMICQKQWQLVGEFCIWTCSPSTRFWLDVLMTWTTLAAAQSPMHFLGLLAWHGYETLGQDGVRCPRWVRWGHLRLARPFTSKHPYLLEKWASLAILPVFA